MQCTGNQRTLCCGVPYAVVHIHKPVLWTPIPNTPKIVKMGPKRRKAQESALSITILGILLDIIPYIIIKLLA